MCVVPLQFALPRGKFGSGGEKKTPPDTEPSRCERRQKYHQSNQAEKGKE